MVSSEANIGSNVIIKDGVIIEKNVVIGDNSYLDYGCIIRENVELGANSYVGARCILGELLMDFHEDKKNKEHLLEIGNNALIRSNTIIYGDCKIGDNFQTGHHVTVREKSIIENNTRIGTNSDIQGNCKIGSYVNIHSNVHIPQGAEIHNFVWIFPYVIFTNDPTPPSEQLLKVIIEEYAIISTSATCLPGITIGKNSLIGAGAVVTKSVGENDVVVGNPARKICNITDLKNPATGEKQYPWPKKFSRRMPWEDIGYDEWTKQQSN